jgi:hypothetical protein
MPAPTCTRPESFTEPWGAGFVLTVVLSAAGCTVVECVEVLLIAMSLFGWKKITTVRERTQGESKWHSKSRQMVFGTLLGSCLSYTKTVGLFIYTILCKETSSFRLLATNGKL